MKRGPRWNSEEEQLFKSIYPTCTRQELHDAFPNRPHRALTVKASELGVKKRPECIELGIPFNGSAIGHLTEAEKGYLAGIIDGEGSIGFARRKSPSGRYVYVPRVSVANTSRNLIDWLQIRLPMFACYSNPRKGSLGTKDCYNLTMAGNRQCIVFLKELIPYLVIKRPQAEIVVAGYLHLSDEERDEAYQKIRALRRV